jgi:serine protease Do
MAVRWQIILGLAVCFVLGACVPEQARDLDTRPVTTAPSPIVPAAQTQLPTEPFSFDKVVVTIPAGTKIGLCRGCPTCPCAGESDVYWDSGRIQVDPQEFRAVFYEPMTRVGYRVVGDPRQLFDSEADRAAARYLVGVEITKLDLDVVHWNNVWHGKHTRGVARMDLTWHLYSLRERRVVYTARQYGQSTIERAGHASAINTLIVAAFADATQRLSVGPRFRNMVSIQPDAPYAQEAIHPTVMEVPAYGRFQGPISRRAGAMPAATVTILSGSSHGSGFFISDDGLILTNQHVVGSAEQINVRLASGMELTGRVLRRHAGRDVALVKVDIARVRPLPISRTLPPVGNEVYALGSPTDPNLAGSLTRGIVSALRTVPKAGVDYPIIQSDVAIHGGSSGGPLLDPSGNVIGIAVSGIGPGQLNAGLNFFIPIEDALSYLNIQLGQPRELRF